MFRCRRRQAGLGELRIEGMDCREEVALIERRFKDGTLAQSLNDTQSCCASNASLRLTSCFPRQAGLLTSLAPGP